MFFALRARHVLFAAGIALEHGGVDNRLFLVERFAPGEADRLVAILEAWPASPFSQIVRLPCAVRTKSRGVRSSELLRVLVRLGIPYANRRRIRAEFVARPPNRVYTCVDHVAEMQYAMHLCKRLRPEARCVYVEDGSAAYAETIPRRGPPFAAVRRFAKALTRRLHHGLWWQDVEMLGTSTWIDEGIFTFPDLVRPELRRGDVGCLAPAVFHGPEFAALASAFGAQFGVRRELVEGADVLVALASSPSAKRIPGYAATMGELCRSLTRAGVKVVVKHHPREADPGFFGVEERTGLHVVSAGIPFEILLLLAGRPDLTVVGDISSAMMSTRWLLPDASIFAIRHPGHAEAYMGTFGKLGITVVDDPAEVVRRLLPPITATDS